MKPRVTQFLIGANVAVFVAMTLSGVSPVRPSSEQLIIAGANVGVLTVLGGEWWRAFTAMFLHIGAVHLLFNMYALWNVGKFVEGLLGRPMYLAVYLLTGLAGSFASSLWNPFVPSAGASGAIFGLFGVIVGFTFRARDRLPPEAFASLRTSIVTTLLFNLMFAIGIPYLDHAAHLGGLLSGVLAGVMATGSAFESQNQRATWGSQAIVLATVVGLAVLATTRTKNNKDVRWMVPLARAQNAFSSGDFERTVELAGESLAVKDTPAGHAARGEAYMMLNRYDEAVTDLRLADVDATLNNAIAWALVRLGRDLDEALRRANAAVVVEQNAAFVGTRCWVYAARGELERARADCRTAVKLENDDVIDVGMLRFVEGDPAGALTLWQTTLKHTPRHAHDLAPWLELARKSIGAPPPAPAAEAEAADAG
ncbi:MAG: rhomboid family intramembrane serine protease [Myxococcaceae bacterium]|nr:rhomboid family intramembrane serine protease [Myxococcaceae bacterium]